MELTHFTFPLPPLFQTMDSGGDTPAFAFSANTTPVDLWVADLGDTATAATQRVERAERYAETLQALASRPLSLNLNLNQERQGQVLEYSGQHTTPDDSTIGAVQLFLTQLAHRLVQIARIETRSRGQRLAITEVGIGGDTRSYLHPNIDRLYQNLHQRTLAAALKTRATWMRVFSQSAALVWRATLAVSGGLSPIDAWRTITAWLVTLRQLMVTSE